MHLYAKIFQPVLTVHLKQCRAAQQCSQERMAELLHITLRSYCELEHGRSCLSAPSLIFLLFLMSDEEVLRFISELRNLINSLEPVCQPQP